MFEGNDAFSVFVKIVVGILLVAFAVFLISVLLHMWGVVYIPFLES